MDRDETARMVREAGRALRRFLPKEFVFALVVAENDGPEMHVWFESDVDPESVQAFLEAAAKTVREPEQTRGGN
jgi:hypothetical protein